MLNETIEKLLVYAEMHLGLNEEDHTYTRNVLLDLCGKSHPFSGEMNVSEIRGLKVPDVLIEELRTNLLEEKVVELEAVDRLIVKIMGILTPRPSEVTLAFKGHYKTKRSKATDYLYDLQVKKNYIQKTAVEKNLHWFTNFEENNLEITINLSKPEKDNKEIAKLKTEPQQVKYPACLLCKENVGYAGRSDHPARGNLRIIPLKLDAEPWYLQYSPYVYYNKHCIVFEDIHEPMLISRRTISRLLAFVDQYPHFFIGSNSDLPIVGGSILDHEHFQGGDYEFPMMKAKDSFGIRSKSSNVHIYVLDWYNTAFHLVSTKKDALINAGMKIIDGWKNYSDQSVDIVANTGEVEHNTVTPIVRKLGRYYHLYIILRNNRTNEQYPDGIFHAHPEHHAIKKEGIGLIEAMGMFILPARLKRQLATIADIYDNKLDLETALVDHPDLKTFSHLFDYLDKEENLIDANKAITLFVNETCRDILKNTAVFKDDEKGEAALRQFIKGLNL